MAAMASGWMIYQSHLAVRSSHWMCCWVWGYENTEKGEDVVRFKSVCGNTLKILDTLFWWTVECRRGSYNQKRVADWLWTSPFCKWPGWYGLSRNRLWLGRTWQSSATTLLYGSNHLLKMALELPNHPEDELFLNWLATQRWMWTTNREHLDETDPWHP